MGQRKIGKSIGDALYLHISALDQLSFSEREMVERATRLLPLTHTYNILKLRFKKQEISFLHSPDFDTTDEPVVGDSYKVNLTTGFLTFTQGRKVNQQIYHHKWLFVKDDYKGFDVEASKRRSTEWELLAECFPIDRKKIGNSDYWGGVLTELTRRRGIFRYAFPIPFGHAWERGVTFEEALQKQPLLFNGTTNTDDNSYTHHPTQVNNTVLTYRKLYEHLQSVLHKERRSLPSYKILDASSGLGLGTELGRSMGFSVDDVECYPPKSYQPVYRFYEDIPHSYDCIICNMVLNILPQDKRDEVVRKLATLLNTGGTIYFIVRGRKEIEKQPSGVPFRPITAESRTDKNAEYYFPSKRSYQKGFFKEELLAYVTDALASEQVKFNVAPMTLSNSGVRNAVGVVVTKL